MELKNKRDSSCNGASVKLTPETYGYLKKIRDKTGIPITHIIWKSVITTYKDILEED